MAYSLTTDSQPKAPDMADLLEYFEARSRVLDEEGQPRLDASTLQFMSLIKFNGVSILPPVLSQGKREEMMSYKHEALRREKTTRNKKKEELQAKVQSIVAGVEERRAAKQAARSSKNTKTPSPSSRKSADKPSSEMVSKVTTKSTTQTGAKMPPSELVINVKDSSKESASKSTKPTKSSPTTGKHSLSPSRSASQGSSDSKKKEHTNYKSLGKLGSLSKQKSFSSQNLDRSEIQPGKYDSDTGKTLSPNSRALLPHPPVGRPPSRGASMRQSSSTPDLRNIEVTVKTDDLKKPLPSRRSLSPKGGRPQAPEMDSDYRSRDKTEKVNKPVKTKESPKSKSDENKIKQDNIVKKKVSDEKAKTQSEADAKISSAKSPKKTVQSTELDKNIKSSPKTTNRQSDPLQNPLEVLEQELTREEESEMNKRFGKANVRNIEPEVRQELDPIQTATAELFPFPISEEQALATLDSLQSDFASLEQFDSLPRDYNGIPLTSVKEQQIIHMLTKLSKALNMEDTLTSTANSNVQGDGSGDSRSVPNGASGRSPAYSGQTDMSEIADDSSTNVTNDSAANSSYQNSSGHSRARMSPTGSSILSSASSVSASTRSRMSPKSLKNTVHFSTTVTEISTSASQSYEDKISYRKLDITPKNSENFEDSTDGNSVSKNLQSEGQGLRPGPSLPIPVSGTSMLNKVALSPSVDSSVGSPGQFHNHSPFENSSQDSDLNTSDKENEFVHMDQESSDENYREETSMRTGRNPHVLNVYTAHVPAGPIGENHPAVLKTSSKPDIPNGNSLKDGLEKVLQENFSKANMNVDSQYYSTSISELDRYIQGKVTPSDSISSMQEEITRSYLLSQNKPEREFYQLDENFEHKKATKEAQHIPDLEDSAIFLQPVIFSNTRNSLKENRSMLDEEDMIRSNLQKVQLDSESESETEQISDSENIVHGSNVIEDKIEIELEANEVMKDAAKVETNIVNLDFEHESEAIATTDQALDNLSDIKVEEIDHPIETEEIEDTETEEESEESDDSDNEEENNEIKLDENNTDEDHVEVKEENEKEQFVNEMDEVSVSEDVLIPNITAQENSEQPLLIQDNFKQPVIVAESTEHQLRNKNEQPINARENTEQPMRSQDYEKEEEAKAEHMQKYLNQVHEHSLHQEVDDEEDVKLPESETENFTEVMNSIGSMIQSFTASINNMNHLSQEELFRLQSQQFESIQQKLIEHQRAQLEELFVAQRKEQMNLEIEIENYQKNIKSEDATPRHDPLKPQRSDSMPQVTQAWQTHQHHPVHSSAKSPPFPVQPVAYPSSFPNPNMSFSTSYSTIAPYQDQVPTVPFQDPRICMMSSVDPRAGVAMNVPMGFIPDPNMSVISHNTSYSTIPHHDPGMVRGNIAPQNPLDVIHSHDPGSSQASNPFIYPSSPSLYMNPKDRDNVSDVSGFAKATPKQLVFSNQSTPVRVAKASMSYKPIQHSPVKQVSGHTNMSGRYVIPEEVFDPQMQPKFDRVSAVVKGYLTRRLLRTPKVQEMIKKLSDIRNFAFSFQAETPIKKGTFTRDDRVLLERIVNQLQGALLDIHEIFFIIPVSERMAIISAARQIEQERRLRESRQSPESVSRSHPKLSKATLKAMERKKKAQLAEEAVFGSTELRPKSAPPATSSPHTSTDISGPLRRHYHSLFVRALRPLQGHFSPITADGQITVREMKERPRTAPDKKRLSDHDKKKVSDTNNKTKKSSGTKSVKSSTNTASSKQKPAAVTTNQKTKKMEKAWR